MELSWLGHACFRLRSRDVAILTDPYGGPGWPLGAVSSPADVVTTSHDDPHHAWTADLPGKPRVLRGPGEYEIGGAMIFGVRTARKPIPDGAPPKNTVFVIQVEGLTVCHLGDLGHPLTAEQLEHVKGADVVLVPVGGQCTLDALEAVQVVSQIEPSVIVPMHYATEESAAAGLHLDGVERFCREIGASDVVPQTRLTVSAASLPPQPTVVLLERRR